MTLRVDVITLFPEMFAGVLDASIVGRARREGRLDVRLTNLRDFAADKRGTVDDKPFGGGPGMVLMCDPVFLAVEHVRASDERPGRVVLLTPQGTRLTQGHVRRLAGLERLILVCGHYEGFDERIRTLADEQLSIGDFVLTGGELPALVVIDAVTRLLPGALGAEDGPHEESFSLGPDGRWLEYPQYTRPREFRGMAVPDVLLSGDHARIARWRAEMAEARTAGPRPDENGNEPRATRDDGNDAAGPARNAGHKEGSCDEEACDSAD
jgi:tRNA (guanine37-N1)-methyltransferase